MWIVANDDLARVKAQFIPRMLSSDAQIVDEIWVQNVYEVHALMMRDLPENRDGVVIDLGANFGAFTIMCGMLGAQVVAYEPNPDNFTVLQDHLRMNRLLHASKVKAVRAAVSAEDGTVSVEGEYGESTVRALLPDPGLGEEVPREVRSVPAFSLDTVLNDYPIVDILKVDVEGSEYQIVDGASVDTLAKVKYLAMEFHGANNSTLSKPPVGAMLEKLSEVFVLKMVGSARKGGMIFGHSYTL